SPNRIGGEARPSTESAVAVLADGLGQGRDPWVAEEDLAQRQLERLARLDHIRAEAAAAIVEQAERQESSRRPPRYIPPKAGDLVLLRRFILDQCCGNKLEARWEGPYLLGDLAWHGKSG